MSVHVISWAWKQELPQGAKLVLLKLADQANDDGFCWPAVRTLARDCGLSERAIQRWLKHLEKLGLITVVPRFDANGRQTSNGYQLHRGRVTVASPSPVTAATPSGVSAASPSLHEPSEGTELTTTDVVVSNGTSAQAVVADVVDIFREHNVPLPSRQRGIIGQQAADLLTSGFERELVVLACVTAIRRGEPQNTHFIATDLALAHAGQRITRREYERALEDEMEIAAREKARRS